VTSNVRSYTYGPRIGGGTELRKRRGDFFIEEPRPGAIAPPNYSPRPGTREGQQMFHVKHIR